MPWSADDPIAKIRRAHVHINALWAGIEAFLKNSQTYGIERERHHDGWDTGSFHIVSEPPIDLALIAGDAMHNARTALDQSIYQLSRARSAERHRTGFPFYGNELDYLTPRGEPQIAPRERALAGLAAKYRAIVDAAQPFNPGNDLLAALAEFDNADKHRLVHPTFSRQFRAPELTIRNGSLSDIETRFWPLGKTLEEDAEVYGWRPTKQGMEVDVYVTVTVAFGKRALTAIDLQAIVNKVSPIVFRLQAASRT